MRERQRASYEEGRRRGRKTEGREIEKQDEDEEEKMLAVGKFRGRAHAFVQALKKQARGDDSVRTHHPSGQMF